MAAFGLKIFDLSSEVYLLKCNKKKIDVLNLFKVDNTSSLHLLAQINSLNTRRGGKPVQS